MPLLKPTIADSIQSHQQSSTDATTTPAKRTIEFIDLTVEDDLRDEILQLKKKIKTLEANIPQCPVCLKEIMDLNNENIKSLVTKCGHYFCENCISELYRENISDRTLRSIACPICRSIIYKKDIIYCKYQ